MHINPNTGARSGSVVSEKNDQKQSAHRQSIRGNDRRCQPRAQENNWEQIPDTNRPCHGNQILHKNWGQVRSDLEPHGITLRKLKSARRIRNDSSHWDPEVSIDSKSHRDASVIYELKEAFTKINRANPNKPRQTKPERPKQQTPNKPQQTRPQPTNPQRESQRQQQPMRKERQHARPKKSNRAMELGITLIAVPSAPMLIIAATGSEIPEYLLTFGRLSILAGGFLVAKGMHTRKN